MMGFDLIFSKISSKHQH